MKALTKILPAMGLVLLFTVSVEAQKAPMVVPVDVDSLKKHASARLDSFLTRLESFLTVFFSLPDRPLAPKDWPRVEETIQQVLKWLSLMVPDEPQVVGMVGPLRPRQSAVITRLKVFKRWLEAQKCVQAVDLPIQSAEGVEAIPLMTSYPGQIPMTIHFQVKDTGIQAYRLMIRLERDDVLSFVSLTGLGKAR